MVDEGRCAIYITLDEGRRATLHQLTIDCTKGWCAICLTLHEVWCALVLEKSRGTKPRVFSSKVAPAGDERYLVCAVGADLSFWCVFVHALLLWLPTALAAFRCPQL